MDVTTLDRPSDTDRDNNGLTPKEKVREFPDSPGVYLMKDRQGRVIYVGKAKYLRSRAGSYFTEAAAVDRRTVDLVQQIRDIDCIVADSHSALLFATRKRWRKKEPEDVSPRIVAEW